MGKLRPGRFLQLHRAGSAGVQQAQPGLAAGAAPVRPAAPPAVPMVEKRPAVPSCLAMASEEEQPSALSDKQVLVLTWLYLLASLLSLLGSSSVLTVTSRRGRCCHIQLRPLFLLALADLLAAAAVLSTATIQLLPAPLFVPAYAACPYGLMLATTFYAVSFLMVVVYAYEAYRTVHGWRAWPVAALQERSWCLESVWQGLPYILAWLVPVLTLLGQLVARGTSVTDIVPRPIEPIVPGKGNSSNETYSLYCSSCLLLIHRAQDICYQYVGRKDVGLEGKIIFFLYLLLVLSCCTLLYRRVKLRCRRNAGAPLLGLERDGFAGRSVRSVSQVSHNFQLVFLLCWAPAFLLTLLSFTSIKPASVYVLYVATVLSYQQLKEGKCQLVTPASVRLPPLQPGRVPAQLTRGMMKLWVSSRRCRRRRALCTSDGRFRWMPCKHKQRPQTSVLRTDAEFANATALSDQSRVAWNTVPPKKIYSTLWLNIALTFHYMQSGFLDSFGNKAYYHQRQHLLHNIK